MWSIPKPPAVELRPRAVDPTDRRGWTLVEVLIAVVIGVLVLGLALALLGLATRSLTRSEERADPREAVHQALLEIRTALGDAWQYSVAPEGRSITFHTPSRDGEVRQDRDSGALMIRRPGESTERILIGPGLVDFRLRSLKPGLVEVRLRMARPDGAGPLETLGALEFTDEIYIQTLGQRDPRIPFSRVLEHPRALEPSG